MWLKSILRRSSSPFSASKATSKRSLRIERLEPREMLAVTTSRSGANLTITGDGQFDNIIVGKSIATSSSPSMFSVTGVNDANGNPTYVNGVANGTTTLLNISGNVTVNNVISGPYAGNNSVEIYGLWINGTLTVNWRGVNTKVSMKDQIYTGNGIEVNVGAVQKSEIKNQRDQYGNSPVILTSGDAIFRSNGKIANIDLNQVLATHSIVVGDGLTFAHGANEPPAGYTSFTAIITRSSAGDDLSIVDSAKTSNVYVAESGAGRDMILRNSFASKTFWTIGIVSAGRDFKLTADGAARFDANPYYPIYQENPGTTFYTPGTGTVEIAVDFSSAATMTVYANGGVGNTRLFSNYISGDGGLTLKTTLVTAPQTFDLEYNVVEGNLTTAFDASDEFLTLIGNTVNGAATLNGAGGNNRLKRANNSFASLTVANFVNVP